MSPLPQVETARAGADHEELLGASEWMRFRSRRVGSTELAEPLICAFRTGGEEHEVPVLDVSPTGLALDPQVDLAVTPGTVLGSASVRLGTREVWNGDAVVVYQVDPPNPRLGLRFLTRLFDLAGLHRVGESSLGQFEEVIRLQARWASELPDDYLVAVGRLRRFLEAGQQAMELISEERENRVDPYDPEGERRVIERFHASWAPSFHGQLRELGRVSQRLRPEQIELARGLATHELLASLYGCPMHRRAYDKPFGYAGDYLMMLLYFTDRLIGNSLHARMLHYASQRYPLGQTVIAREAMMRRQLRELVAEDRPIRIASLACGPALEIQRLLGEVRELKHPLQILLIDQDEQAMQYCHENLNRQILECDTSVQLKVELDCLHLSVRQIVQPRDEAEARMVARTLYDLDFIYSAGLYDYLSRSVATHLTNRLYSMLKPGGRLFLGNLKYCDVTSWIMDFVLAWHLEYRQEPAMLDLASELEGADANVTTDETSRCMFLDVRKQE